MNNKESTGLFIFTIEDTPDNILKFITNPNVLITNLEYVGKYSALEDIICRRNGFHHCGIHRKYSEIIERARCHCYIKHQHRANEQEISITNVYYTMSYNEILKLIEGKR